MFSWERVQTFSEMFVTFYKVKSPPIHTEQYLP